MLTCSILDDVIIYCCRKDPNSDPRTTNRAFVELAGQPLPTLNSFSINTFGDCCTTATGTAAIMGAGALHGGTVTTNSFIDLAAGSQVSAVTFHFASGSHKTPLQVDGDLVKSTVLGTGGVALAVSGELDLDDSNGGRLVYQEISVPSGASANYSFSASSSPHGSNGGSGMLQAFFAGDLMLLQCAAFGLIEMVCGVLGGVGLPRPALAPGKLTQSCRLGTCTITALYTRPLHSNETGFPFEVRRLSGFG